MIWILSCYTCSISVFFLKNKLTVDRKGELTLTVIFGELLWLCQDFSTPTLLTWMVVAVLCSTEC